MSKPTLLIPASPLELEATRLIFEEYANGLGVDLCFQNFSEELATLPGDYAEPNGGLRLAKVDGEIAGCCAFRRLEAVDYPNACEMKRLYVRPPFRRLGLGRLLVDAVMDSARVAGYASILLDTLDEMESARTLYQEMGFHEIPPYYHNPIAGAHYLMASL